MANHHYSTQAKTLALLPKFTGFLSLLGSLFIFQDITFHKKSAHRVYHRLVLGLSCSDMAASFMNILSTWPIPEGTSGVFLASGTTQTCTAQGFFAELFNMATPLYNASLCAYYVLVIRQGWSEDMIRSRAEPVMHILPITVALTISILGLPFKLYNNSGWLCWIAEYPANCKQSGTCTRGQHADTFRWIHYAFIWSAIFCVTMGMYSIYKKVKAQEATIISSNRMSYTSETDAENARRGTKSKKVAVQAALFVGALYITWLFTTVSPEFSEMLQLIVFSPITIRDSHAQSASSSSSQPSTQHQIDQITRIYQIATGHNEFFLLVLMAIFFPLQGFFNALIYIRPRYLRCRSRNPDKPTHKLFFMALHHESHPIHGSQMAPNPHHHQDRINGGGEEGRRSSTSSFYSMGTSKKRLSDADSEDAFSIDTEMAKAGESICQCDDSFPVLNRRADKAVLGAVAEDKDGGDVDDIGDDVFEDDEEQEVRCAATNR